MTVSSTPDVDGKWSDYSFWECVILINVVRKSLHECFSILPGFALHETYGKFWNSESVYVCMNIFG